MFYSNLEVLLTHAADFGLNIGLVADVDKSWLALQVATTLVAKCELNL